MSVFLAPHTLASFFRNTTGKPESILDPATEIKSVSENPATLRGTENGQKWRAPLKPGGMPIAVKPGVAGGANLKSVVVDIPDAHKPTDVLVQGEGRIQYRGFPPLPVHIYTSYPVLLFKDGLATTCGKVNPLSRDIDGAVARNKSPCRVWAWRKSSIGIEVQKQPGAWTKLQPSAEIRKFRPGETIDVRMTYGSTYSANVAGGLSVHANVGGGLVLEKSGRFELSGWSSTLASNSAAGTYTSSTDAPITGKCYLDGHIIAFAPDGGGIFTSYIAGVVRNGEIGHIYLGDQQYSGPQLQ